MRRMSDMGHKTQLNTVLTKQDIFDIREEINLVQISETLEKYIIELVFASRRPGEYDLAEFANYVQFGVSPRASIALNLAAKTVAFFDERDYVLPEDIKEVAADVMNHRIIMNYEAEADGVKSKDFVEAILRKVPIS
jgi:MoxR-like ATPase